jgi:hypothetical protein
MKAVKVRDDSIVPMPGFDLKAFVTSRGGAG